jgi:hypothetical protein
LLLTTFDITDPENAELEEKAFDEEVMAMRPSAIAEVLFIL